MTILTPIILLTWLYFQPIDYPKIELPKPIVLTNEQLVKKYAKHYWVDESLALRIWYCESWLRTHAKNKNSSASWVYQHLRRYWPARAKKYWFVWASVFNAEANIAVSMWMLRDQWTHPWASSSGCWNKKK